MKNWPSFHFNKFDHFDQLMHALICVLGVCVTMVGSLEDIHDMFKMSIDVYSAIQNKQKFMLCTF